MSGTVREDGKVKVGFPPMWRNNFHKIASRSLSHRAASSLVITPQELRKQITPKTRIIDVTWFMPNVKRSGLEEWRSKRIPGSRYLDLDEVASEHELHLPHMMPSPVTFAKHCTALGVSKDSHVILYDTHGVFSAPRALFMFKAFGHPHVSVLNGGLLAWSAAGGEIDTVTPTEIEQPCSVYPIPPLDGEVLRSYAQMFDNSRRSEDAAELVLDARSEGRFKGVDPEPRPSIRSGHMPHSISVPFNKLLATKGINGGIYTTLLTPPELRGVLIRLFSSSDTAEGGRILQRILGGEKAVVVSCGSGMTAAIIWLALQELGAQGKVALYDESWTGYAQRPQSVILD